MSKIPDFGTISTPLDEKVTLTAKATVPGMTLYDLVKVFETAKNEAGPHDHLSANPAKWPTVRGVDAVVHAVLKAVYDTK